MELAVHFGPRLKLQEVLAPYTYIKIGGPAEYFLIINSAAELETALKLAKADHLEVTILGSASNICISDLGLTGLVIVNRAQKITLNDNNHILAESGTLISQLVNFTVNHSLQGLEEFLGLPGTVGGAVVNNSHHLDHLIGDHIKKVLTISKQAKVNQYSHAKCHFGYDSSIFQTNGASILTVEFALKPGDSEDLKVKSQAALLRRKNTQPLGLKSSGCMFKNPPPPNKSAGFMIDHAGLKNHQVGGARVSEVHANFIVNDGDATAADIVALSNLVRQKVQAKYHLALEREIFFLGNHPLLET